MVGRHDAGIVLASSSSGSMEVGDMSLELP